MWILPLLGYVGVVLGFAFLTLAIASGLYYLSELVEEHTVFAKKLLYQLIFGVVGIQVLLLVVDRFPIGLSALSIVSHVIYAQNLRRFPIVKLTDPLFLVSCALVIANHYLWFRHFSAPPANSYSSYPYARDANIPSFTEIASYFGLCVWLVPFALFVSLSAGENVLPSMGSEYATGDGSSYLTPGKAPESFGSGSGVGVGGVGSGLEGKRRARSGTNAGMAKAVVTGVKEWATPSCPPTFVSLPCHFHPILMDRVVKFIYTSDYEFGPSGIRELKQKDSGFHTASLIPETDSPTAATNALVGIRDYAFHLRMHALGEELDYDALKTASSAKLAHLLVILYLQFPSALKDAVDATFAPAEDAARICKDEDGALQQVVVAAVIAHEGKSWDDKQRKDFTDSLQAPEYAGFWNAYNTVKGENKDYVRLGDIDRAYKEEWKRKDQQRRKKTGGKVKSKRLGSTELPLRASDNRAKGPKGRFNKKVGEWRRVGAVVKATAAREDVQMELD
ncbi:DUF396-domain-containing protein [Clathrospora elynae]|uniref:DUF396-domain-containing protein n=1 Tax=Clathrospora elynae TaxID=706981 RepID=A0A6A5T0K3_9PLEO|nr:DUF396-domain-containing protein [Clathrospora elynae]